MLYYAHRSRQYSLMVCQRVHVPIKTSPFGTKTHQPAVKVHSRLFRYMLGPHETAAWTQPFSLPAVCFASYLDRELGRFLAALVSVTI